MSVVGTRTLLITDDHESVRLTLDFVLSQRGYRVLLASSGNAALEIMRTDAVDGALVDLHMPVMDGFQTCTALLAQARESGRTLPVWMMTAGASSAAERRALEVGAIRLLSKPFNHEDLINEMERHFSDPLKSSLPSTSGVLPLESRAAAS